MNRIIKNKSKKIYNDKKQGKVNKSLKKKRLSYNAFNVKPKVYNINDYKIILLNYPCYVTYIECFINNGNINEKNLQKYSKEHNINNILRYCKLIQKMLI